MSNMKMKGLVSCSSEVLCRLRKAVLDRHGRLYGMLKAEVDAALSKKVDELESESHEHDGSS